MSLTQINANGIAPGTITAANLDPTISLGGPKITNVQITDSSWTVLDDTAISTSGGYVKITGEGFQNGCIALAGGIQATSTTFVSSTEVRAQFPVINAGSYVLYISNPDGGVGIRINGITASAFPVWSTTSPLSTKDVDQAISIQLSASEATVYALAAGSSLPPGLSLSSAGVLSGTVTGLSDPVTYTFTVVATDPENQNTSATFSITINTGYTPGYQWAWGGYQNGLGYGQGKGNSNAYSYPYYGYSAPIVNLNTWKHIAAGQYSTAMIRTDGTLWTVGSAQDTGRGSSSSSQYGQVGSDTNWKTVEFGDYFAVALKTNGTIWSWGNNSYGRLGLGNNVTSDYSPSQIGAGTNWIKVTAHPTARNGAGIKSDGTLWTWGRGDQYALGNGSNTTVSSPVQVAGTNWVDVFFGSGYAFGVKGDGTLWGWGTNGAYQLGTGSAGNQTTPVQVGVSTGWASVRMAASNQTTYAIKSDGTLWVWGYGSNGSLGIAGLDGYFVSTPVQLGSATTWKYISTATDFVHAIKTDGTLWTWGNNNRYMMGVGTSISSLSTPTQITGGTTTGWLNVKTGYRVVIATKTDKVT